LNQSAFVAKPEHQHTSSPQNEPHKAVSLDSQRALDEVTRSISAIAAASYHWNIATDEISWHGDTTQVFNHIEAEKYANGRAYASLLDPDNFTSRFETVMGTRFRDNGQGVPFSIEYSIKPFGRDQDHLIWVEDTGRWFAGPDGRPSEVYGLVRHIDDRHRQNQHLQFLSNCDPLTGMLNRGRLTEVLGETIELAKVENFASGFLIVSVSNLAIVNEAYGFDLADDVITKIARRLRRVVRAGDIIGRISGSKFGVIMARATKSELLVAAERFLTVARQKVIETEMGPVWAMLSIGGVALPNMEEDANLAMAHAEEALSEAAKRPTDSVVIYEPSVDRVSKRKLNSQCAVEIVHSLKENQFTLSYQPVINAATGQIQFHEALLRMRSDSGEIVTAGHLVTTAEKLGLIRLIDQVVIYKVLQTLRQFPQAKIALNISAVTANDPRWFGKLTDLLEENIDITNRLTVEITETVALSDIDQIVKFIEKLHTLGCKVALDDFGAGFTSFKNLQILNVDKVKIDGSFCQNLSNNKNNQFFVHTLINLCKKFNLKVVAEWVESNEDAELLASWGVDYLQGRLYGMAESTPWGEPINEDEEVCVVPSEILFQDTDEQTQPDDNVEPHIDIDDHQQMLNSPYPSDNPQSDIPAIISNEHNENTTKDQELTPASTPFAASTPDIEPDIIIPDLPIEEDEISVHLEKEDQTDHDHVAKEVSTQNLEPSPDEQSPLNDELKKLRQAIDQFNDLSAG